MTLFLPFLLPREDFAPVWEKVAATIRTGYYARVQRKDEMEALLAKTARIARAAPDRRAFQDAVNGMIAEFKDSHFELLSDEDQGYYLMDGLVKGEKAETMPQIGAWFRRAPDGYTVQMVLEGGAAEKAGLKVGDRVTRVGGHAFSPVKGLEDEVGKAASLTYQRDGREAKTKVEVTRSTVRAMFLQATLASRRTIERSGKRFAVLHLWTQTGPEFQKALQDALKESASADGLILDLRGGFGGYVGEFVQPLRAYGKPLAIVIDHGSRSAKELLSFDLQRERRAVLVGERTAGNVLGAAPKRLTDWAYLEIPATDYVVHGVRLEGNGVAPDVEVPPDKDPIERAAVVLAGTKV